MSDDVVGENRLDEEASPYLRQHADNPVNWQPWDERALSTAREQDVPIFLSIGYSACHWCHVMEDESFEDEEIAALLNERFVPIKVDREERPDLDRIYQTICQLVSGGGGWPLSVWLTPEGEPFYVGTYFPRESRQGMPGFGELLRDLANSWETDREEIERRADQWTRALTDQLEDTPDQPGEPPSAELLGNATSAALRSADRERGGFGSSGPKFPHPRRLDVLLRSNAVTGTADAAAVATEALDAMAAGGIYDQLGGGFHRYATDRSWTVPHFEKMLYDNAELARVYLAAARAFGTSAYARIGQETLAFLDRELRHPDGGFYATLDAESRPPASRRDGADASSDGESRTDPEREEGAFYVWTPDEVREAVDDETTAAVACDRWGIDRGGNFEGGTTVPTVDAAVEDVAEAHGLSVEAVNERLMEARTALFAAREERPRPARDEKVLAGWNGLAISAFAAGARTLDPGLADVAREALEFVREHLWDADEGRLARRYKDGDVKGPGYLEDYAFLARGAFDLYQATGDVEPLAFALELARTVESEFWDEEARTLYFTPASGERLVARPQELTDQSTPSSLGVAVGLLLDLAHFAPDAGFDEIAGAVLATHGDRVRSSPLEYASLVLAADQHHRGATELTLAAEDAPAPWWDDLAETYVPAELLAPRPATETALAPWLDALGLSAAPPIWRGREARDGPTVYACANFTCSPPESDLHAALEWLEDNA
ncbi:MAG: thioredoxin domain-containing protein [Haloferacaceae archaeon]